jgi:signal transduction histidine kinase
MAAADFLQALRPRIAVPTAATSTASRLWVVGTAVSIGAVAIAVAGTPEDAAFGRGLVELLIVALPIAAGIYALRAPAYSRFGIALLGIGFAWSLTALAETSLSVPYTIGRLATWLVFPCVVYLLLAFPDGNIAKGLDRVLLAVLLFDAVVLFYGTAPLVPAFPPHTPWATCTTDCPANALLAVDHQPQLMSTVVLAREWLVELLWVGMFVSMYRRWRKASPLLRQTMAPVFLAAVTVGLCHIAFHTARQLGAPAHTVVTLGNAWTFAIVALCATFLVALFWRRVMLAGAMTQLSLALRRAPDDKEVRDAIAGALSDPDLRLLFRDDGVSGWRDSQGRDADLPDPPPRGRAVTVISDEHDASAIAIIHDAALRDDEELLGSVSSLVLTGWRHERLISDLGSAMAQLDASRHRIAEIADLERARIERDIHDGAQQRLIAIRMKAALAEDMLDVDPEASAAAVHELGAEAENAIDELRSLARGVYPSILSARGLVDALRAAVRTAPHPVEFETSGVTRYSEEVESAIYFVCMEALQNAMKHAAGATQIRLDLVHARGMLVFEVSDDGPGFTPRAGSSGGLRNMQDRLEAVGGRLIVDSSPGHGTRVWGAVEARAATRSTQPTSP